MCATCGCKGGKKSAKKGDKKLSPKQKKIAKMGGDLKAPNRALFLYPWVIRNPCGPCAVNLLAPYRGMCSMACMPFCYLGSRSIPKKAVI